MKTKNDRLLHLIIHPHPIISILITQSQQLQQEIIQTCCLRTGPNCAVHSYKDAVKRNGNLA